MHRSLSICFALFLITVTAAATAGASEPTRVSVAELAPAAAGAGGEMIALTSPAPGPAERWRLGLAAATEARDLDIAAIQAELAQATGADRVALERRLQTRKLDFEIEVLELQLTLATERAGDGPADETAARLESSLDAARTIRDGLTLDREAR